jgi:pimeloyl-ACP methyl ester carboxylesterase
MNLLFTLLLSLISVAPQAGAARASFLRPCRVPDLEGPAWCGKYEVYEDRAARRGRRIGLHVVVLPALAERPAPDPVFFFAGGPGQDATSLAGFLASGPLARLRRERELVFVDQRGTGESNPLACPAPADDDLRGYFEEMFPPREVRACRERLEKIADLRQYTTTNAVEDLDELRRALGYGKLNLYGGSYGTTVALAYLRRYPAAARSAVLAGVAPTSLKLPLPFARGAQHALDGLFRDCAADAACRAAFPNLREELRAVLARLDRGPVSVEAVNPLTQKPQLVRLARGPFAERLRMMLYDQARASLVPLLIHRAAAGDFAPFIAATLPPARATYNSISFGMYFTVTCAESVPFITEDDVRRESAGAFLGDYRVRVHQAACREWPRADVPEGFTDPVKSDAPVLLLSGELDPASPHWLGAEAVRHLPNGLQATIPSGGHGYFSPCLSSLVTEFVTKGSARGLDTSCLANSRRPPFITALP